MIKAKHNIIIYPFFIWFASFLIKRKFKSVNIKGEFEDNGNSILIIANHISWWDGFWIMLLKVRLIKRKFHFMMLEEQLKKHWFFRYTGGYSIKKKTREIVDSLNYTLEILKDRNNMALVFPEGKIKSLYNSHFEFEKGIERIIEKVSPDTQVVFVANMVDYFSDSKPNLYIYLKTFVAKDLKNNVVEKKYNEFYAEALKIQKAKNI